MMQEDLKRIMDEGGGNEQAVPAVTPPKRVALVIGNGSYKHVSGLRNPTNDATAMIATLKSLEFEVIAGIDLNVHDMDDKLAEFARSIRNADIAIFYYAGHGLQVDGENYLVPVDAKLAHIGQLTRQTVKLKDQLAMMHGQANAGILIMDCCRDNPFVRSLARSVNASARSIAVSTGLARMDETTSGSLVAFATAPNDVADDGNGLPNSPYTAALIQHLPTPGQSITDTLTEVAAHVANETRERQTPWYHSSLRRQVILQPLPDLPLPDPGQSTNPEPPTEPHQHEVRDLPPTVPELPPDPDPLADKLSQIFSFFAMLLKEFIFGIYRFLTKFFYLFVIVILIIIIAKVIRIDPVLDPDHSSQGSLDNPSDQKSPDNSALGSLISVLGDINDESTPKRRSTVALVESALDDSSSHSKADKFRIVRGLVRMAANHSRLGMSAQGRYNLFYLLNTVDRSLWVDPDWAELLADARDAWADLMIASNSGDTSMGSQTIEIMKQLKTKLTLPTEPLSAVINFSNVSYGGSLTRIDAANAIMRLELLNWNVLGPDGATQTTVVAKGKNEVRYGTERAEASAEKLVLDLQAAGYPVSPSPLKVEAIGDGPIEIWLSRERNENMWISQTPIAGWCFQRKGPETSQGSYSVRCHKDPSTCLRVRNGSPGEKSTACTFVAELDATGIDLKSGGTDDSYYKYSKSVFSSPFPQF